MKVSVIIPTYNRPHDLSVCLDSILTQTVLPLEVIMVDNGSDTASELLGRKREKEFADRLSRLCYVRNDRNSLTAARNLGIRLSQGDIVLFLDDDVILDANYIREIIKVYEMNPDAVGVQGYIVSEERRRARDLFCRIFFLSHREPNSCRVLPSIDTTCPLMLDKIMMCQRLSGVSSYKQSVLKEFQFDEQLIKYSDGEDVDFSSRVLRRYPRSLFITPFAKYINSTSMEGRVLGRELVYMREVYGSYLFYKLFKPTFKNILIYLWSRIGRFMLTFGRIVFKQPAGGLAELWHLVGSYHFCLRHIRELKHGDLNFFNKTLK